MTEQSQNATSEDVLTRARESDLPVEVIGHSPAGEEIIALRSGGKKGPPILITAGAHGDEPSGTFGALALLEELDTDYATYIVPLRDPFAWNGFDRAVSFALQQEVDITEYDQAEEILRSSGQVIFDQDSLLIVTIGSLGFAFKRPGPDTVGPREIWGLMQTQLPHFPTVVGELLGKRIILPSNLHGVEGCGRFNRGYTVFVTPSGQAGNLNRFFGQATAPPEVRFVMHLFDRIQPGLVLDLHEGQGSAYYVFASGKYERRARILAQAMITSVKNAGYPVASLAELSHRVTPSLLEGMLDGGEGVIVADLGGGDAGKSLATYTERPSVGFTCETGRWTSLASRVAQQVAAVQGTVLQYETMLA